MHIHLTFRQADRIALSQRTDDLSAAFKGRPFHQYLVHIADCGYNVATFSKANEEAFSAVVEALDREALTVLRAAWAADATMSRAFDYIFDQCGTDPTDFARELKRDFAAAKVVNVNDSKDLEARQIALNSLEDRDNEIRVIFAVDKLNEGWDVLNLFDIVRLYDAQTNATSTAEKQLIGRGARYFPFESGSIPETSREKRKLDEDVAHPLRVLEELYYHCSHNPQYIAHIREVLATAGIVAENEMVVTLKLKDSFRQTEFFKNEVVMANERIRNTRDGMSSLAAYSAATKLTFPVLMTGRVIEGGAFGADGPGAGDSETVPRTFVLPELGVNVLRHALDSVPFYRFESLRHHFPQLSGMREFMESNQYLGGLTIEVRGTEAALDALGARDRLKIAQYALGAVEAAIRRSSVDWNGSTDFKPTAISTLFGTDKQIKVSGENAKGWRDSQYLQGIDLSAKDWHVFEDSFGTSEEKLFIRWVNDRANALKEQFSEFYLIRNERVVRLYTFDSGKALEPDFLLFLRTRSEGKKLIYQLFIEPKGQHLLEHDQWKEDFLKGLHAGAAVTLFQGKEYRVFGLPFFNEGDAVRKQQFEESFAAIVE